MSLPSLEEFKEKYNVIALTKAKKGVFDDIQMEQLNINDIESLLKNDTAVKHRNIAKFPDSGTTTGSLHEAWTMIKYLESKLSTQNPSTWYQNQKIRIYMSKDITNYYVMCWGQFGNEDVYDFKDYFEIKPQYKGWKAGEQFGL
jgi:hypothetical protein